MDAPSTFDTFSIAMTSVPKSLPILSNIYKIATDIRETTERVEINKKQCEQLSERIDTLIGFLAQRDLSKCLNEAMHKALNRFETFLLQCLEYISTFIEATWFKRIVGNKEYEKKFQDLNRELTQYSNDLNFGIGLNIMTVNKTHDENDEEKIESDEADESEKDPPQQKPSGIVDGSQRIERKHRETSIETNKVPYMNPAKENQNGYQAAENIFVSGLWLYRYYQYNQWFGPFQQQIVFNPMTKTLNGCGVDNVGQYLLNGSFSVETGQLEMMQHYQIGTGNPNFNIGHKDAIQLTWNASRKLFEGMGYSQSGGNYVPGSIIEMSHA
ncbi:unnamed protein product [Rotaria socialis]|uniref:Mixed lineage kinase domain-containing protein n=3 Tax=Rotaria socialis TaxID=392032 RepID=A0A820FS29_9BILA|nr:unnamed protein product [Rotaria socialis]CAF3354759.1 unnamed protein product [Rotaria socialis]CAF3401208.1 unnamed protein product [Rotaria socialis]CAF3422624.1 unnamed protein product [Rotaria socialis]CAF4267459.1 unnamed protein product [Rotaria socialis]